LEAKPPVANGSVPPPPPEQPPAPPRRAPSGTIHAQVDDDLVVFHRRTAGESRFVLRECFD
jgi:hypothetical protein